MRMNRLPGSLLLLVAALAGTAVAQPSTTPSRGQLLYTTHCIECHNTQVHWRDQRLAGDWDGLMLQVRRWQATAALGWDDADIVEVSRHLNDTFYRYPQSSNRVSLGR